VVKKGERREVDDEGNGGEQEGEKFKELG